MGLFDGSDGGNFDPSNWVDMKIYHDVMDGKDSGGFGSNHGHNNKHNNKNDKFSLGLKIINIIAWVGFFIFLLIKVGIDNNYKYPDKTPYNIEIAFTIIPVIWVVLSYVIGFIILHFALKKDKTSEDGDNKNEES